MIYDDGISAVLNAFYSINTLFHSFFHRFSFITPTPTMSSSVPSVVGANQKTADELSLITNQDGTIKLDFKVQVNKEDALFEPHPEAKQLFTLERRVLKRQDKKSRAWSYAHVIKNFNCKLDLAHFYKFIPDNVEKSPVVWACCNVCGAVLTAKSPKQSWTGGSINRHLRQQHGIGVQGDDLDGGVVTGSKRSNDGSIKELWKAQSAKGVPFLNLLLKRKHISWK